MTSSASIRPGVYRHNKTGNLYEVIGLARHTESDEELVVYRSLQLSNRQLYVRPSAMFCELVELGGQRLPRFEPVDTPRTFIA